MGVLAVWIPALIKGLEYKKPQYQSQNQDCKPKILDTSIDIKTTILNVSIPKTLYKFEGSPKTNIVLNPASDRLYIVSNSMCIIWYLSIWYKERNSQRQLENTPWSWPQMWQKRRRPKHVSLLSK